MQYWHLSGSTWPAAPTTELKMLTWPPDLLDLYPIDRKRQRESISICCQCRIERAVLQVLCPCLHGSSRVPQRPDGTGVGSVWKPGRHLEVLGPFLNSFHNVAGCTIGESSGVYFICRVSVKIPALYQDDILLLSSPVSPFNVVADWCNSY